jgi:hypothetical protein
MPDTLFNLFPIFVYKLLILGLGNFYFMPDLTASANISHLRRGFDLSKNVVNTLSPFRGEIFIAHGVSRGDRRTP